MVGVERAAEGVMADGVPGSGLTVSWAAAGCKCVVPLCLWAAEAVLKSWCAKGVLSFVEAPATVLRAGEGAVVALALRVLWCTTGLTFCAAPRSELAQLLLTSSWCGPTWAFLMRPAYPWRARGDAMGLLFFLPETCLGPPAAAPALTAPLAAPLPLLVAGTATPLAPVALAEEEPAPPLAAGTAAGAATAASGLAWGVSSWDAIASGSGLGSDVLPLALFATPGTPLVPVLLELAVPPIPGLEEEKNLLTALRGEPPLTPFRALGELTGLRRRAIPREPPVRPWAAVCLDFDGPAAAGVAFGVEATAEAEAGAVGVLLAAALASAGFEAAAAAADAAAAVLGAGDTAGSGAVGTPFLTPVMACFPARGVLADSVTVALAPLLSTPAAPPGTPGAVPLSRALPVLPSPPLPPSLPPAVFGLAIGPGAPLAALDAPAAAAAAPGTATAFLREYTSGVVGRLLACGAPGAGVLAVPALGVETPRLTVPLPPCLPWCAAGIPALAVALGAAAGLVEPPGAVPASALGPASLPADTARLPAAPDLVSPSSSGFGSGI